MKPAEEDNAKLTNEEEVAINLNNYFSNYVVNFKILKFQNFDSLSENINYPTLKAIVKYRKHFGIIAIASQFTKE